MARGIRRIRRENKESSWEVREKTHAEEDRKGNITGDDDGLVICFVIRPSTMHANGPTIIQSIPHESACLFRCACTPTCPALPSHVCHDINSNDKNITPASSLFPDTEIRLSHRPRLPILLKELANVVVLVFVIIILPQPRPILLCDTVTASLASLPGPRVAYIARI